MLQTLFSAWNQVIVSLYISVKIYTKLPLNGIIDKIKDLCTNLITSLAVKKVPLHTKKHTYIYIAFPLEKNQ